MKEKGVLGIMELIFFYVNQSRTKFIEKQGFNFSSRYKFFVEYDKGTYILKGFECENPLSQNFFDETGCITNVTAVVGENGSGKTTLLTKLLSYADELNEEMYNLNNSDFLTAVHEVDKIVVIYLDGTQLCCYHNMEKFEVKTELLPGKNIHYLGPKSEELKSMISRQEVLYDISRICVSNSMYAENTPFFSTETLGQLNLNMNSLQMLGKRFFRKKIRDNARIVGEYYGVQDIIVNEKQITDFQHILDILYLDYLRSNGINSVFAGNIGRNLFVSFRSIREVLNNYYNNSLSDEDQGAYWRTYYEDIISQDILGQFDSKSVEDEVCIDLYINVLHELILCLEKNQGINSIRNKGELIKTIEDLLAEVKKIGSSAYEVLLEAYEEIQEYDKILGRTGEIISTTDTYQNFMKLIKKSVFERKYSFVLKYIDIQGIELASGERALLNFFSWIYFVPKFTQIMREEKKESMLHKNILLLIDEIDLYCHPLWQQKMLAFLIDELKNQYSDKKVQIIFTTHSPIILSDIPRSNVIFLKRENDRCKIDDNRLHSETFGANIYKLFNNAFFLGQKGQIGEFSRNKIQAIINKISPKLDPEEGAVYHEISKKEAAELEKEIVLIGEPIIRNKLYDMLYKCQYCLKEPQERKLEIYRKKLQKLEEEMRHDIH